MPDFSLEAEAGGLVAGVDEAGRGPLAGPVVAGAVVFLREPPAALAATAPTTSIVCAASATFWTPASTSPESRWSCNSKTRTNYCANSPPDRQHPRPGPPNQHTLMGEGTSRSADYR